MVKQQLPLPVTLPRPLANMRFAYVAVVDWRDLFQPIVQHLADGDVVRVDLLDFNFVRKLLSGLPCGE